MAKKQQELGSMKRIGIRYGKTVKLRLAEVEKKAKATYKCPHCRYEKAQQQALGIWHCDKCDTTFTGKAYTLSKEDKKPVAAEEDE